MRKVLASAGLVLAVVATSRPASAAESCDVVAARLRAQAVSMAPPRQPGVAPATPGPDSPVATLFVRTLTQRPDCRDQLLQIASSMRDAGPAPKPTDPSKTPLGPIGWFWLTIYTDVFRHSPLLMAIFGWQLFLAPLTIVVCGVFVLRGALDGVRRPVRVEVAGAD